MIRALTLLLILATPATADPAAAARAAIGQLDDAIAGLDQAGDARDRVRALTEVITAFETGLAATRDALRRATLAEATLREQLDAREAEVARLLGALQVMGRTPAPVLLIHPEGPTGTARAGMMLSDVTPALQVEVDKLRREVAAITNLRDLQLEAAETLQIALSDVQAARSKLGEAIAARGPLPKRFTADPMRTAVLIGATQTLGDFAANLSEIVVAEDPATLPTQAGLKGALPLPVDGTLLRAFGEEDAAGIRRPGILIAARPLSLVTAPSAVTVRYAGPLLDYGNVIILEPAQRTLVVLAGLADVYVDTGAVVAAGLPLGLMGQTVAGNDGGADRTETLYIEVRDGQTPVNPDAWFTLQE
ncbi:MAG: murein hydrolase activator EnvC family protein [Shimia sp.]